MTRQTVVAFTLGVLLGAVLMLGPSLYFYFTRPDTVTVQHLKDSRGLSGWRAVAEDVD